jgi:branched-chain amino acid transport system ATP-binding protein
MLLEVDTLQSGYGSAQVLFGVTLSIAEGEAVTLMGRNGMGKTTTVRTIMGLLRATSGRVRWRGRDLTRAAPHIMARAGVGLVPEGRHIFPNLSVRENLVMAERRRDTSREAWTFERVIDFFPRLGQRLGNAGNQLSGGEQQMLAIGRALMTNPDLLILDEATEGLAPVVREEIWARLGQLKQTGLAILVIDKELEELTALADRHYIIEKGEIVWSGASADLITDKRVHETYLGV